jgi:uncharacterized membrane protein
MKKSITSKMVGLAMVLPLPLYLVYLLLSGKLLGMVICLAVCVGLFHFGLKLLKGDSFKEVGGDALRHLDEAEEEAEKLDKKLRKR